jgi:hypothetical protein
MASKKKVKLPVKKFWTRFIQKGKLLLRKGKRFISILAIPLNFLKDKYRRWPRILQIASLYLLVVILSGAVYLWRSAQLRTINPYLEDKFNFKELEDEDIPGNKEETLKQEEPAEAAEEEHEAAPPPPSEKTAEASRIWPVKSRELEFGYSEIFEKEPYMAIISHHGFNDAIGIKALPGKEVHSIAAGTVKEILDPYLPYGKMLVIEHEDNLKAYYGALDQIYVGIGQKVARGEVIATVGQNPEGDSYLYLQLKRHEGEEDWVVVNPGEILP